MVGIKNKQRKAVKAVAPCGHLSQNIMQELERKKNNIETHWNKEEVWRSSPATRAFRPASAKNSPLSRVLLLFIIY